MIPKRLLALFFLTTGWLMACTEGAFTEPTPIPPPPDTNVVAETAVPPTIANPTPVPTELALEPTPTLSPTVTTTVIDLSPGESNPPVQVISSQPLPSSSRDLLFLADGAFKQWNHANGQIETVVAGSDPNTRLTEPENQITHFIGDIFDYSMSADGKRAVVARLLATETITRTLTETDESYEDIEFAYELLFVDMISREVWTLVPQVDNLGEFQLSPDAQQLTFTATGLDGIPETALDERPPENLYIVATGGGTPSSLRQVYTCQTRCHSLAWHVESNLLAFADGAALWLYNIVASEPEMLLENELPVLDATPIEPGLFYSPIAWAKNGRYLLIRRGNLNDSTRLVLDVPTGTLSAEAAALADGVAAPDVDFLSEVSWMPDDRLLVVRTVAEPRPTPVAELWRFDLATGQLLLDESTPLSEHPLGVTGGTPLEDGRFAFALALPPNSFNVPTAVKEAVGTYLLTSFAETPERVNSLPPPTTPLSGTKVLWAKDGSGALLDKEPFTFYAPASGEFLYEITAVLGQNPHRFQWQPEIIVP